MRIATDRRSIQIGLDQAPEMRLSDLHERLRRTQVELAQVFVEIQDRERHVLCACATIEQLGVRFGFSEEETRALHLVGRALALMPEIEALLLEGDLTLAAAEALGRVARTPELRDELAADDAGSRERRQWWLERAKSLSPKQLRRLVQRRVAEARNRVPSVTLVVAVSMDTEQDIDRARVIASRKADRTLTRGETIGEAVRHYLDCFDPLLRGDDAEGGTVRRGSPQADTDFDPARRKLPTAIQRLVRRRANDCCEYPGCTNDIYLEFAHIVPHARGGDRSERNILLLCRRHHFMLDSGMIRFGGWDGLRCRLERVTYLTRAGTDARAEMDASHVPRDEPAAVG